MIRDQALAASGLLNPKIGGPSVKPYQPDGIWEVVTMPESDTAHYVQDTGDQIYRRSMYTFWKRQAPPRSSTPWVRRPGKPAPCAASGRTLPSRPCW